MKLDICVITCPESGSAWDQLGVLCVAQTTAFLCTLPCPLAGLFFLFVFLTGSFSCSWLFDAGVLLGPVFSHLTMHYLPLSAHITLWEKNVYLNIANWLSRMYLLGVKDAIFLPSLYSVVFYQFYFTGQVLSGSDVEGKRSLCTRISTGEVRKVKHTGFLQWKEIFTCPLPGMLGKECRLQPGDLLLPVEPSSPHIPQNLRFTYPRPFSPKSLALLLGHRTHPCE